MWRLWQLTLRMLQRLRGVRLRELLTVRGLRVRPTSWRWHVLRPPSVVVLVQVARRWQWQRSCVDWGCRPMGSPRPWTHGAYADGGGAVLVVA